MVWTFRAAAHDCFAGYKGKQSEGFPIVNMLLKQNKYITLKMHGIKREINLSPCWDNCKDAIPTWRRTETGIISYTFDMKIFCCSVNAKIR